MVLDFELSEDEKDCLQELINVAYGTASASISEILDSFATLNIPNINIIETPNLKNYLVDAKPKDQKQFISSQVIHGEIPAESLFIIDIDSADSMTRVFNDEDSSTYNDICDVVIEITNILSSATIGKFAELLSTKVSFEAPSLQVLDKMIDFDDDIFDSFSHVIIISTILEFEELNIFGELIILMKDKSISKLKSELNEILEDL